MSVEAVRGGPKLRTKTGCLTCRNRRKKCDEQYPLCNRCTSSSRTCLWPSQEALRDRRYGSRRVEDVSNSTHPAASGSIEMTLLENQGSASPNPGLDLLMESVSRNLLRQQMEPLSFRHFFDGYYAILTCPNSHLDFYNNGRDAIQKLMEESKALQYSVLANAASHLAAMRDSPGMEMLALDYYSKSMRSLVEILAKPTCLQDHSAVLMSVMLLYVHCCFARSTYIDITWHLNAATRIIQTRFLDNSTFVLTNPFDRVAVESSLYNSFMIMTSYWGQVSKGHNYNFDAKFWLDCENLLKRSTMYPGCSTSCNNTVLGIPITLFKLNLALKRIYDNPQQCTPGMLSGLRRDITRWETKVSLDSEYFTAARSIGEDTTCLYIFIASLLIEDLAIAGSSGSPQPVSQGKWQLEAMLEILRRRQDDDDWHRTFLANWPVYTTGFFVSSADDVDLIRNTMERRWEVSRTFLVARYRDDLEKTWIQRQLLGQGIRE